MPQRLMVSINLLTILALTILEVRSSEFCYCDDIKKGNNPNESFIIKGSFDNLIKNPIRNFFSRIDQFFTDFMESRIPYLEDKSRAPYSNDIRKLFGSVEVGDGVLKSNESQLFDNSVNTNEPSFDTIRAESHHEHKDHKSEMAEDLTPTHYYTDTKFKKQHIEDKDDQTADDKDFSLGWFSAFTNPSNNVKPRQRRLASDTLKTENYYPNLVEVYNDGEYLMTGVSISELLAVTSATGLRDKDGNIFKPRDISIRSLSGDNSEKFIEFKVRDIFMHPEFKSNANDSSHDVALLKIYGEPEKFSHFDKSLPLQFDAKFPVKCSIITWDKLSGNLVNSTDKYKTKNIFINLSDGSKCKNKLETFNEKEEYCSLDKTSGADRGSPLVCSGALIGILSGTNDIGTPVGIYSKLNSYRDSIHKLQMESKVPESHQHDKTDRTMTEPNTMPIDLDSSRHPDDYQVELRSMFSADIDGSNTVGTSAVSHFLITACVLVSASFYPKANIK